MGQSNRMQLRRDELAETATYPEALPDLSLVLPVYNEDACIAMLWSRLHAVLQELKPTWEVIFVDDGSRDRSLAQLIGIRSFAGTVRVLRLDRHRGQSAALDAGFRAARGSLVITLDADLQNPPEEIPRLIEAAQGYDLVFGRRQKRLDSSLKRLASRIGNMTRDVITGHHVADTGCSLKIYRRLALRRIPMFTGMHRFLPTLFVFHGFRVREIDVRHEPRAAGVSKHTYLGRAWRGLLDCFAVRWMQTRALRYDYKEIEDGRKDAEG